MAWLYVVNFREIPPGKLACWRTLLREAGGERSKPIVGDIGVFFQSYNVGHTKTRLETSIWFLWLTTRQSIGHFHSQILAVPECSTSSSRLTWGNVASKLRFFTPGPIQGISSLNITKRYFILRERVHQYNGRGRGAIDPYHGSPLLGYRQACMDQRR
jgi:hypothetical protein